MTACKPETSYYPNDQVNCVIYKNKDEQLHRIDGPAYISFYKNGQPRCKEWWVDGRKHNTTGPAIKGFYSNGNLKHEVFYIDGKRHNTSGPAAKFYFESGNLELERYWIDGKQLSKEDWEKATKPALLAPQSISIEFKVFVNGREVSLKNETLKELVALL